MDEKRTSFDTTPSYRSVAPNVTAYYNNIINVIRIIEFGNLSLGDFIFNQTSLTLRPPQMGSKLSKNFTMRLSMVSDDHANRLGRRSVDQYRNRYKYITIYFLYLNIYNELEMFKLLLW